MNDAVVLAEKLNRDCECVGTEVPALQQRLDVGLSAVGIERPVVETHPHLFADVPVFVAKQHAREMQRVISAVESVTLLPAFREQVLGRAPEIARSSPRPRGVFCGFDFHIAADGPKLIEINTNAGGALLNIEMQRAQQACCTPAADFLRGEPTADSRALAVLVRAIPRTLRVTTPEQPWWNERKQWFFKPSSGFGSRGTYRGDKITRRAFGDVMRGNYIAQEFAPPSERWRGESASGGSFKLDVRNFVYDGAQQLLAARLYRGQTTNFRSAGGGFAPVYVVDGATQGPRTSPPGCTRAR